MPKKKEQTEFQENRAPIDSSILASLNFGPKWSDSNKSSKTFTEEDREAKRERPKRPFGKPGFKDRRPEFMKEQKRFEIFKPTITVEIYPEDEPFMALTKAMKTSCKTYELFEIAHLIIEKPERFVAVITRRKDEEGERDFYISPIDGMIFETENQAIAHTLKDHADKFFDVQEIEVEGPKGSFQVVSKCGVTGELLGPPNYHRYQDLIKEHYESHISNMSYDKFLSKIETVRDEAQINEWVEKLKKQKQYTLKGTEEGEEPKTFMGWENARLYLLMNRKKDLVSAAKSARLHGSIIDKLPNGDIKKSAEMILKKQREFPLDTANNLRGRLRRMHFNLYKKGAKAYVCWAKRKFRQEGMKLADNMELLVNFIENTPGISVSDLANKYLGIEVQKDQQTAEQQAEIRKLMLDLRWLVTEGYVTEFGNGMLLVPPPMTNGKAAKIEAQETEAAEEIEEAAVENDQAIEDNQEE